MKKQMMFCAAVLMLLTSGCVVVREYAPAKETVQVSKEEYTLARELLVAFVKNDGKKFVSLLPEETRSKFTEETFAATRKSVLDSMGEPVSYTYLATLKLEPLHPQLWKVTFRRQNVNRTKEFTSEILFKVVTGKLDKKQAVITGFHFL
ncbi:MAG: hypothetical protein IKC65_08080 [Lentisphaeria bacterium]|nr:hypothetical protein [Lentisphaeria bacterium]